MPEGTHFSTFQDPNAANYLDSCPALISIWNVPINLCARALPVNGKSEERTSWRHTDVFDRITKSSRRRRRRRCRRTRSWTRSASEGGFTVARHLCSVAAALQTAVEIKAAQRRRGPPAASVMTSRCCTHCQQRGSRRRLPRHADAIAASGAMAEEMAYEAVGSTLASLQYFGLSLPVRPTRRGGRCAWRSAIPNALASRRICDINPGTSEEGPLLGLSVRLLR